MHSSSVILTERLELVRATHEHLISDLGDKHRLSWLLDAVVPESWPPEHLSKDVLREFIRMDEEHTDPHFTTWYWIRKCSEGRGRTLVGSGGILSSPASEGTVVIGYGVLDDYQGQGFATEAVQNLIPVIFECPDVLRIVATTYPGLPASVRVLEKNGFFPIETSGDGVGIEEGTLCFARER